MLTRNLKSIHRGEAGQGMLEYMLIVVVVVLGGIAAWQMFGARIRGAVLGSEKAVSSEVCKNLPAGTPQDLCYKTKPK